VLKSQKRTVATLDIGAFYAKETVLYDSDGNAYHSQELRELVPYRCTFGYDVIVYVGYALFIHCHSEKQIIESQSRINVYISQREIGFLGQKFITYLAIAHHQSRHRLKAHMLSNGGYILHMDGTCEGDSPHLFTGMDGIAQIVLDNVKLPSEKAEMIIAFLRKIQKQYGDPVALVHDMGRGILSAVKAVFKDTPDYICHFHFLRDIGKDLMEPEYSKIRSRLKKHKIRSVLRRKAKALEKHMSQDEKTIIQWLHEFENDLMISSIPKPLPVTAAYAMIHWVFETSGHSAGYGFPFDCPHWTFYKRLKVLHAFICKYGAMKDCRSKYNKSFFILLSHLARIVEDQQLIRASSGMETKSEVFNKLRKALSIAEPEGKKGLNDDGLEPDIKSIEDSVKDFRKKITGDKNLYGQDAYKGMIKQIDKYWEKLFADPIIVNSEKGEITLQPQRTNNILERFFRDFKRGHRKKSGTISLSKILKSMLADIPLVKNLENLEYVRILLDGCSTLEERFSRIDNKLVLEKLKKERDKYGTMSPELKKIVRLSDLPSRLEAILGDSKNNSNGYLLP